MRTLAHEFARFARILASHPAQPGRQTELAFIVGALVGLESLTSMDEAAILARVEEAIEYLRASKFAPDRSPYPTAIDPEAN